MYQREIESLLARMANLAARVVELEDKVAFLLNHEPAPYVTVSVEDKAGNEAEVVRLLQKGKELEAIKLYRAKHEMPLEDARKAVEELRNKFAG